MEKGGKQKTKNDEKFRTPKGKKTQQKYTLTLRPENQTR